MTTSDKTGQTWRDVTGLTTEQIAQLEYCEAQQIPPGLYSPQTALRAAQAHARSNEAQARFAGIAVPADATDAPSAWMELEEEQWWRTYTGHRAVLDFPRPELPNHDGQVVIEVVGHQYGDGGTVERYVHVNGGGVDELTAGQAREVAAALIAAADDLDKLSGDAPPF